MIDKDTGIQALAAARMSGADIFDEVPSRDCFCLGAGHDTSCPNSVTINPLPAPISMPYFQPTGPWPTNEFHFTVDPIPAPDTAESEIRGLALRTNVAVHIAANDDDGWAVTMGRAAVTGPTLESAFEELLEQLLVLGAAA